MKTVSVEFKPGEPPKIAVAECHEVLDEIREADLSTARVVYFGWLEPDGTYHIASHGESTLEAVGLLHMHIEAITMGFLGVVRERDGDDEEEDEDDA